MLFCVCDAACCPAHTLAVTSTTATAITFLRVLFFTLTSSSLRNESLRNRKRPAKTKSSRSNLQPRRGLLAFVLVSVHQHPYLAHQLQAVAQLRRDLFGRLHFFDIRLQDAVQHLIRRKGIRVLLIRPQL